MNDASKDLTRLVDNMWRAGTRPELLSLLRMAKTEGIPFDIDTARSLSHFRSAGPTFLCPAFIPAFIAEYLKDSPPDSILDAWTGVGATIGPPSRHPQPAAKEKARRVEDQARPMKQRPLW